MIKRVESLEKQVDTVENLADQLVEKLAKILDHLETEPDVVVETTKAPFGQLVSVGG